MSYEREAIVTEGVSSVSSLYHGSFYGTCWIVHTISHRVFITLRDAFIDNNGIKFNMQY